MVSDIWYRRPKLAQPGRASGCSCRLKAGRRAAYQAYRNRVVEGSTPSLGTTVRGACPGRPVWLARNSSAPARPATHSGICRRAQTGSSRMRLPVPYPVPPSAPGGPLASAVFMRRRDIPASLPISGRPFRALHACAFVAGRIVIQSPAAYGGRPRPPPFGRGCVSHRFFGPAPARLPPLAIATE